MRSAEFIRRVRQYSKRQGLEFYYDPRRGKGSHGRLFMGERLTTIKSSNKTIGKGLLRKMLKDLDIDPKDF
jgi:mRNA interferase HicA